MNSRLSTNMIANIAAFAISILVSMWLTPFIIHSLGAETYGFIPLTQQLINYMSVITIALNGMAARFFTVSVKSGDEDLAERYFNTSLISSAVLSLFIIIPLAVVTCFISRIVNVPDHLVADVQISLAINGAIFILSLIGAAFGMAMFCENRLDISGILGSMNTIFRSLAILMLINLFTPKIWLVSFGTFIAAVILFVQNIYYFKKLMPGISISILKYDFSRLKELLSSGIWSSINFIGAMLFLQIDMLVANWALGAKSAGEYTAVLQLSNLLRGFVATIVVVFGPTMVALYAKKDLKGLVEYSNKAVKITGIIMALPIGLAYGLGGVLLTLWLGEGFQSYSLLFVFMTLHLSVNLSVQPLFGIFSAANRVRMPAVFTLIMGTMNFVLALILSMLLDMGAYGIVVAGMIVLTAKNLIFTPIYSAAITKQPLTAYYRGLLMPVAGTVFVASLGLLLQNTLIINDWISLFTASSVISIVYLLAVFIVVLNGHDRQKLKAAFLQKLNTFRKEV